MSMLDLLERDIDRCCFEVDEVVNRFLVFFDLFTLYFEVALSFVATDVDENYFSSCTGPFVLEYIGIVFSNTVSGSTFMEEARLDLIIAGSSGAESLLESY